VHSARVLAKHLGGGKHGENLVTPWLLVVLESWAIERHYVVNPVGVKWSGQSKPPVQAPESSRGDNGSWAHPAVRVAGWRGRPTDLGHWLPMGCWACDDWTG